MKQRKGKTEKRERELDGEKDGENLTCDGIIIILWKLKKEKDPRAAPRDWANFAQTYLQPYNINNIYLSVESVSSTNLHFKAKRL